MQLLGRMNQKMDQGYKITSYYCTFCSGVTLMKDRQSNVYCPKCDKEYKPVFDQQDDQYYDNIIDTAQPPSPSPPPPASNTKPEQKTQQTPPQQDKVQKQYNEFLQLYNSTTKTASQLKSQKVSKKMGQLLVNGWGMMEEACQGIRQYVIIDCNVPLMRSKKGNLICCGCDRDYSKNVNEKKVEIKKQTINIQNQQQQKKTRQTIQTKQIPQPQLPQLPQHQHIQDSQNIQNIQNIQSIPPNPQVTHPNNHHHHHDHSAGSRIKMQEMSLKTLQYLDSRLDKAFTNNDLELIERVLKIMKNIKQLS